MPGNFHEVPESVVESWPKPNFTDPVRREWMPAFAITWQVGSTLLVAGRFYLRARRQAGSFGLDDLMIFIGWLFSIGFTTVACIGAGRYDLDRHTWDVHPSLYVGAALVSPRSTDCFFQKILLTIVTDRLDRPSPLHLQHGPHQIVRAPLLPPHGQRQSRPPLALRHLHRPLRHRGLWNLHLHHLLSPVPAPIRLLGVLRLQLRQALHVHQRKCPYPDERSSECAE